jgi:hypothetical protein
MSETTIHIKLKINFPVILFTVLFVHALLFTLNSIPSLKTVTENDNRPMKLNIRRVKTEAVTHPHIRPMESIINNGATTPAKTIAKKHPVSLKDLSFAKASDVLAPPQKIQRPGSRPEVLPSKPKAMNAISLKSDEFKNFSKSFPSGGLAISDMISGAQKISDAVVSIEVPEGIKPDELNEYELKFYSFQKRTAINYVNSILKNLDKFQRSHPRYQLPSTGRITMTARISYDSEGNVKQIKMVRWTHVSEMQNMFEDIVKGIDQLHNPPKLLWEKDGEFAMFYTLEILNG